MRVSRRWHTHKLAARGVVIGKVVDTGHFQLNQRPVRPGSDPAGMTLPGSVRVTVRVARADSNTARAHCTHYNGEGVPTASCSWSTGRVLAFYARSVAQVNPFFCGERTARALVGDGHSKLEGGHARKDSRFFTR